jgi:competence protein ComEA
MLRDKLDDQTEIVINGVGDTDQVESSEVVADLSGAVTKPGVYTLPAGSRISDLLQVGEGFLSEASATWVARNLNLSLLLEDSQKVYIPFEWDLVEELVYEVQPLILQEEILGDSKEAYEDAKVTASSTSTPVASSADLVNVNSATLEELDSLPGIGPKYAQKIIDSRPYQDESELIETSGIPESTITKIQQLITY